MAHETKVTDHAYKEDALDNVQFEKEPTFKWEFQSNGILLQNDSFQTFTYSWNGKDVAGTITPSDKWIALDLIRKTQIWLKTSKATTNGSKYRITVWRGEG